MDHRKALPPGVILPFPGMSCQIEETTGRGTNAIVYNGWYADALHPEQKHRVLIKELFPLHPRQGVRRGAAREIQVSPQARDFFDLHRKSFETGNRIHLKLLERHPSAIGANLNSFPLNGTLYTVLGYSGGSSLAEALSAAPCRDLSRVIRWMLGLLEALEVFHDSGFLHLDVSPDNILLLSQEHLFLIDYNSAREAGAQGSFYASFKQGYSAPELKTASAGSIGFPADLYSVAAVFYRCLMGRRLTLAEALRPQPPDGGDSPLLADASPQVKAHVRRILQTGLHTLPQKRWQTTAQLRRAFRELEKQLQTDAAPPKSLLQAVIETHFSRKIPQFDAEAAELGIERCAAAYSAFGWQYQQLAPLAQAAREQDPDVFAACHAAACRSLPRSPGLSVREEGYLTHIEENLTPEKGQVVPWSGLPFSHTLARELIIRSKSRRDFYASQLPLLAGWMAAEAIRQDYPCFADVFAALLEADARLEGELYHAVCAVHLSGGRAVWQQALRALIAQTPALDALREKHYLEDRDQHLENLRRIYAAREGDYHRTAAGVILTLEQRKER